MPENDTVPASDTLYLNTLKRSGAQLKPRPSAACCAQDPLLLRSQTKSLRAAAAIILAQRERFRQGLAKPFLFCLFLKDWQFLDWLQTLFVCLTHLACLKRSCCRSLSQRKQTQADTPGCTNTVAIAAGSRRSKCPDGICCQAICFARRGEH